MYTHVNNRINNASSPPHLSNLSPFIQLFIANHHSFQIIQIAMSAPNTSCGCCGPQEAEVTTLVPPFRVTTSEFSVSVKDRAVNEISRNFHSILIRPLFCKQTACFQTSVPLSVSGGLIMLKQCLYKFLSVNNFAKLR